MAARAQRIEIYKRLMEVQKRIAAALSGRSVSNEAIQHALDTAESL